jgi:hypothetical protein
MASTTLTIRSTPDQRLANFNANSNSIYNKFSPYTNSTIGPTQPFVYTHISDSESTRNFTKYDTQESPSRSITRDVRRIGKYLKTGKGLLYVGKQFSLQKSNAFNETRVYNPLSVIDATSTPEDHAQRHVETSGGILNFFADAFLTTLGVKSRDARTARIDGTATGGVDGLPYSQYSKANGGARAGLVRYNTAIRARDKFDTLWVSNTSGNGGGSILFNLGKALINTLTSFIPSTNPMGAFGGNIDKKNSWVYRPEYPSSGTGIYFKFLSDAGGFLSTSTKNIYYRKYYNNGLNNSTDAIISNVYDFHKYSPEKATSYGNAYPTVKGNLYAGLNQITNGELEYRQFGTNRSNNIETMLKNIVRDSTAVNTKPQLKRSAEMYKKVRDNKGIYYPTYEDIPSQNPKSGDPKFYDRMKDGTNIIKLDDRMFSKVSKYNISKLNGIELDPSDAHDEYNAYDIDGLSSKRDTIPKKLTIGDQSKDLIFFYFFDLIKSKYIPFRATISSLSDQHSADWEDIHYLGRADKLFLYKGFSRDVGFSFTVYANSAKEMLPMWNRINYLVGLTKPSKYTNDPEIDQNTEEFELSQLQPDDTGKGSRFMYPPMVTLRLGDLFYDQPCVISSVGVNVPDDTNWESLRTDEYYYHASPLYKIVDKAKSRQLPMKVDVSVQLKLMEKRLARGSDGHYGNSDGKDWKL